MTKIKICGLMTSADIKAVNEAHPDLAGFIFAKGRHQINLKTAMQLRKQLDKTIPSVGVFVDAPVSEILKIFNSGVVSMIQLHGNETESVIHELQEFSIPVIKVFKPRQREIKTAADYLMYDSGSGNGQEVNWNKYDFSSEKPIIIAGSLNIQNIQRAIQAARPTFVDLSRGVETNGQKDPQKINRIVKLVHQL